MIRAFILFSLILISPLTNSRIVSASTIECHLHSPGDITSEEEPAIFPSVGNPKECEQLNQEKFFGEGRCHCSFNRIRQGTIYVPEENAVPQQVLP